MWIEQFLQDMRYACRNLVRSRAFVMTTVPTLAVGLGLLTVVFAVFNAYVLRPFAVRDPGSLHEIAWRTQDDFGRGFAWREYQELRGRRELFDAVIAQATRAVASKDRRFEAMFVSGDYFSTLSPRVFMGRGIADFDVRIGHDAPVAVLSHLTWTRLFDADPQVLGREVDVNGRPFVIVGVLGPEFAGLDDSPRDIWLPLTMYPTAIKEDLFGADQPHRINVTVRLGRDVSVEQAESALTPFIVRVVAGLEAGTAASRTAASAQAEVRPQETPNPISLELLAVLSPVFAAFALVLIAACANVSNMLLARAMSRHREIAVRLSVGATRGRLVRQLLTEGLVIAAAGGLAGLVVAALVVRLGMATFFAMLPPTVSSLIRVQSLDFDPRVFVFAFALAAATTMMFALLPALHATRLTLTDGLKGQPGAVRHSTLRNVLVAGQVAVSIVLVIVAGTLVRNQMSLARTDLGYQTGGLTSVHQVVDSPSQPMNRTVATAGQAGLSLMARAAEALRADSRITSIAATSQNPLFERVRKVAVTSAGGSAPMDARYTFVSSEYFSMLGIPIVAGRGFSPAEEGTEARVAIVSAATAATLWPRADPIGQTFRVERPDRQSSEELVGYESVVVVGVAKDVVSGFVVDGRDPSHVYLPTGPTGPHASAMLVQGRVDAVGAALRPVHGDPFAFQVVQLDEMRDVQMFPLRSAAWIGSVLGAIGLLLSVSGLYGVLNYTWSQRTREVGIRMALGATTARLIRLVMMQAGHLAGAGGALGLLVAFAAMKLLASVVRMQNVSVLDGRAFGIGAAIVTAAAVLAAYSPARRASRVNPSDALRADG